jgi:hypothetical protein
VRVALLTSKVALIATTPVDDIEIASVSDTLPRVPASGIVVFAKVANFYPSSMLDVKSLIL